MKKVGHEALIPNKELEPFKGLIGKWKTQGAHRLMPEVVLNGMTSFEWVEEGSFIVMRSEIDEPGIPSATALIGSDDVLKKYFMLYFDERNISRVFELTAQAGEFKWWRNAPNFSQRFTLTLTDFGKTMLGLAELSEDNTTWQKDLELTYSRVE